MAIPTLLKSPRLLPKIRDFCLPAVVQSPGKHGSLDYSTEGKFMVPRTSAKSPVDHRDDRIGYWYTVDPDVVQTIFGGGSLPKEFTALCTSFGETSIMLRKPALEVIDYVKRSNLSQPPNKFLLYGKLGVGKTISLAHIVHFLIEDGWILVHIPWAPLWRRPAADICPSAKVPECFEQPIAGSNWLQHFKSQNSALLNKLDLRISKSYEWTNREKNESGSPMIELVDHGIARQRFSNEVVMVLNNELKNCAINGKCKLALVVDGINSFFCDRTFYKTGDTFVNPNRYILFQAFSTYFNNDWKNGCIVGAVDEKGNDKDKRMSYMPRYLLQPKGWDTFDPFVPILVDNYEDIEIESIVRYYAHHEWLQTLGNSVDSAKEELAGASGCNPLTFMNICSAL